MKKFFFVFLIFTILIVFDLTVMASDNLNDIIKQKLDSMDLEEIDNIIKQLNIETEGSLPEINIKEMVTNFLNKDNKYSLIDFLKGFFRYFTEELLNNSLMIGKIIVLAVIYAILKNLQGAFENGKVAELSYFICYMVFILVILKSFYVSFNISKNAIDTMVNFMYAILPIVSVALITAGSVVSASLLKPAVLFSIEILSTITKDIIIPLIFFSAILTIINNFSDKVYISKLSDLLKSIATFGLGLICTIFLGVLTVEGLASSTIDGVTIRSAKFAVGALVPVVGGIVTDTVDAIISASLILKNLIGVSGIIVLGILIATYLVKLLAIIAVYKITAAVIQPISENRLTQCVSDIAGYLTFIFISVLSVGIMFFIAITAIIGAANITVMMR